VIAPAILNLAPDPLVPTQQIVSLPIHAHKMFNFRDSGLSA
jgi:hypothetical protein